MKNLQDPDNIINESLEKVRSGDNKYLKELYEKHRIKFIGWFRKNHQIDEDEIIELYQKSFTTFYFNVKDEKITELRSSIETYLFGIGKNLLKELFRSKKNTSALEEIPEHQTISLDYLTEHDESHLRTLMKDILNRIEEPCKSILYMYYFKNFSMESIANNIGYKNEAVAKKKKCLCIKKVRELYIKSKGFN